MNELIRFAQPLVIFDYFPERECVETPRVKDFKKGSNKIREMSNSGSLLNKCYEGIFASSESPLTINIIIHMLDFTVVKQAFYLLCKCAL